MQANYINIQLEDQETNRHPGQQMINQLQGIVIKQKYELLQAQTSDDTPNIFKIYACDQKGEQIQGKCLFKGNLKQGVCDRIFLPYDLRPLKMKVINHGCYDYNKEKVKKVFEVNTRDIFKIERDYKFPIGCFNRPSATVTHTEQGSQQKLGTIEYPWLFLNKGLNVLDSTGNLRYNIEASCFQSYFWCTSCSNGKLVDFIIKEKGKNVGKIIKQTLNCQDSQQHGLMSMIFPLNSNPNDKIMLIAASLMIDLMRNKEKKSRKRCLSRVFANKNPLQINKNKNNRMSDINNDHILYADDSQYINEITSKLAKIRQTLGIEIYEQDHYRTPQSDGSNQIPDKEYNTFGKDRQASETKELLKDVQDIHLGTNSKQDLNSQSIKELSCMKEETQFPQQISFLQNKLEALKQIYPCQGDQASFLERENVYLKIELELKSKQERFVRNQLGVLQEEFQQKYQQMQQQMQDLKQQHEDFVEATDLSSDIKQYILALESDLHLTKQELDLFTQRLAKEQSEKEQLKQKYNNSYQKARDEFQGLYEKAFKELNFMCQALSAELMSENIEKKVNRVQQQTNISKMYQDVIDEKLILETKIDDLENQLESYQNKQTTVSYNPSVKSIYEKRLHVMKQGLLHWKTRTQQIEQIVLQWIQKLRQENAQLKNSLVKQQNKMFSVFENMLREIHMQFESDKQLQVAEIKRLQEQKLQDSVKITQLRSTINQKGKKLKK